MSAQICLAIKRRMRRGAALLSAALCLTTATAAAARSESSAQEVNVYSYRQSFLLEPIFDKFTAATGIDVNLIAAPKGLVERIKAEGKHSPADLLLTSNYGRLQDAVTAGITQRVDDAALNEAVPAALRDPQAQWFALTYRARVLYVSKSRVPEGIVSDYAALADPAWRGRICTRSGTHDYNLALLGSFIHHWGEDNTKQWLKNVKSNLARKPQGNDRAQVKAIKQGLCDIAIGNSYYYGLMLSHDQQRVWADAVRIVFPNQNSTGTHINISGMAMMKYAPNRDHALTLMRFLRAPEIQQLYAEDNHEYPIREDVPWSDKVRAWGEFKRDDSALAEIYQQRRNAFTLVNQTGFNH